MATDGAAARSQGPRALYLTLYNALSAGLWASILISAATNAPSGKLPLFQATEPRARWVQTFMLIDVAHAAVGLVKSSVSSTALQVVARTTVVWMVWYSFPESTASSHAYLALVLAWSMADTIRYTYLALNLHGKASGALVWLRYTMFYPLYPIGFASEWWLLYSAIESGSRIKPHDSSILLFLLVLIYTWILYAVYPHDQAKEEGAVKEGESAVMDWCHCQCPILCSNRGWKGC